MMRKPTALLVAICLAACGEGNSSPFTDGMIDPVEIYVTDAAVVDVAPYFMDPEGDPLMYDANADGNAVRVSIAGSEVTITGISVGEARVEVLASDNAGGTAVQIIEVTVLDGFSEDFEGASSIEGWTDHWLPMSYVDDGQLHLDNDKRLYAGNVLFTNREIPPLGTDWMVTSHIGVEWSQRGWTQATIMLFTDHPRFRIWTFDLIPIFCWHRITVWDEEQKRQFPEVPDLWGDARAMGDFLVVHSDDNVDLRIIAEEPWLDEAFQKVEFSLSGSTIRTAVSGNESTPTDLATVPRELLRYWNYEIPADFPDALLEAEYRITDVALGIYGGDGIVLYEDVDLRVYEDWQPMPIETPTSGRGTCNPVSDRPGQSFKANRRETIK